MSVCYLISIAKSQTALADRIVSPKTSFFWMCTHPFLRSHTCPHTHFFLRCGCSKQGCAWCKAAVSEPGSLWFLLWKWFRGETCPWPFTDLNTYTHQEVAAVWEECWPWTQERHLGSSSKSAKDCVTLTSQLTDREQGAFALPGVNTALLCLPYVCVWVRSNSQGNF